MATQFVPPLLQFVWCRATSSVWPAVFLGMNALFPLFPDTPVLAFVPNNAGFPVQLPHTPSCWGSCGPLTDFPGQTKWFWALL